MVDIRFRKTKKFPLKKNSFKINQQNYTNNKARHVVITDDVIGKTMHRVLVVGVQCTVFNKQCTACSMYRTVFIVM